MKLSSMPQIAKLLLAALVISALATVILQLVFVQLSFDGSPPQRGIAAAFLAITDFNTFVVVVLPQFLVLAAVSFVSMLVAAAIVRKTAASGLASRRHATR